MPTPRALGPFTRPPLLPFVRISLLVAVALVPFLLKAAPGPAPRSPLTPGQVQTPGPGPGPARTPAAACAKEIVVEFRATIAGVTAQDRATLAQAKIATLPKTTASAATISMRADAQGAHVFAGETPLFSLTPADNPEPARAAAAALAVLGRCLTGAPPVESPSQAAPPSGTPVTEVPRAAPTRDLQSWWEALRSLWKDQDFQDLAIKVGVSLGLFAGMLVLVLGLGRVFRSLYVGSARFLNKYLRPVRFRAHEVIRPGTVLAALIGMLQVIRILLSLLVVYAGISYGLTFFARSLRELVEPLVRGMLSGLLVTYVAALLWQGLAAMFAALQHWIHGAQGKSLRAVKVRNVELFSEGQIVEAAQLAARIARMSLLAFFAYIYITIVFSFFSFSAGWADALLGYVLAPLRAVVLGFVGFLPNLFFIVVMILVTRYLVRFLRMFFEGIQVGRTALPGFHAEWAKPTFKIVTFILIAFTAVLVFPYLPGAQSEAFKGVGLFVGLLFSLGSTAVVANVVAGVVLTYMRPFKVGDRVKIADTVGDVVESTLLVTRIRTVKNVEITVPNGLVLGTHIINYSAAVGGEGVILHTAVTIGYDVPWRDVHKLLLEAAERTGLVVKNPNPFVLQTELSDFYVAYELNCYTREPQSMAQIYSELHQHIQDVFNEGGVEILSPHYRAQRDGNEATIPAGYLPDSYQAPGFRVQQIEKQ